MTDRPLGKSVHLWDQRPRQNFRHQSVEPRGGAKSMCGCLHSHRANVAPRGRPGRPLPYSRSYRLVSSSQKDSLSLPYFAFRNGDDDDDDGENDESQRGKIWDDDEYESDNM